MKNILLVLSTFIPCQVFSQLANGNFENSSGADLSAWEWTCGADSFNNAPPFGGNWCIQVYSGNFQGCFPGYAYQKLPSVVNGQTFMLSGWAYAQVSQTVGIYFGTINNGVITLQSGDFTSASSWYPLSVQSSFTLAGGDTAVVVLSGGTTSGAVQGYGYFDLVNLELVTGITSPDQDQSIHLFPNPTHGLLNIQGHASENTSITISDTKGKPVKKISSAQAGLEKYIDISDLDAGIYFLQITDNNSTTLEKIIKL